MCSANKHHTKHDLHEQPPCCHFGLKSPVMMPVGIQYAYILFPASAVGAVWCIQAAEEMGSLQQRQRDSAAYQAAVAARAATGAAAANLRKRCNQCEACLTSQVTPHPRKNKTML